MVRRMLLREERTLGSVSGLALWFAAIFTPGVVIRVIAPSYVALDLAMEGSLLAGITGGYVCGWMAGMLIAIPSMIAPRRCHCRFSPPSGWAADCCAIPRR